MEFKSGPLLSGIQYPEDLRKLSENQLPQLSNELRDYIVDIVSQKGGHFGASLGVVELTVALHYVFDTPYDNLLWDVGHQAYGHKILTGRKESFHTNRIYQGISGFPKRKESPYDVMGVGHSSTSISAAVGMAVAARLQQQNDRKTVAVIGDGAMTAGLAFEGLNHGGGDGTDLLVILNDNCMSIDPNVGALKEYLTDISTSHTYNKVKDEVWHMLGKFSRFGPTAREVIARVENAIKASLLKHSNYFESLNWRYFGPVDGHDVNHLVKVLEDLKDIPGPKILHTLTQKGKGYKPAEEGSPTVWHAPGLFNKETGEIVKVVPKSVKPPKFQDVFGYTIIELAEKNEKIVGITPAMPTGCSLKFMMDAMPDRAFDVGIAEQHAVTFSAGLAAGGQVPFCNIYSSFMQRAYDSVIHDVAIQNLHVVFCLDRGGLVGADGPTHHGAYDIAFFRCIPNMIVSAPLNEEELRNLMYSAQLEQYAGPWSIRFPRGEGTLPDWKRPLREIKPGTGQRLRNGSDIAILSFGAIGVEAIKACEILENTGISVAHYDLRFAKPLDEILLHEVFSSHQKVITLEDGCIIGGIGSAVLEFMADHNYRASVVRLGIPDRIVEHGTQAELYRECEYDAQAVVETAKKMLKSEKRSSIAG
jgi:1-deoxy-D-xylulose-5-phosphate synthase